MCLSDPIMQMGSTADTSYFLLIVSYSCNASGVTAGQAELYVEANQTFQEQKGSSSQSLSGGLRSAGWLGRKGELSWIWEQTARSSQNLRILQNCKNKSQIQKGTRGNQGRVSVAIKSWTFKGQFYDREMMDRMSLTSYACLQLPALWLSSSVSPTFALRTPWTG